MDRIRRRREKNQSRRKHTLGRSKFCVECGKLPANFWDNNLCEDCFKKLLSDKVKE